MDFLWYCENSHFFSDVYNAFGTTSTIKYMRCHCQIEIFQDKILIQLKKRYPRCYHPQKETSVKLTTALNVVFPSNRTSVSQHLLEVYTSTWQWRLATCSVTKSSESPSLKSWLEKGYRHTKTYCLKHRQLDTILHQSWHYPHTHSTHF